MVATTQNGSSKTAIYLSVSFMNECPHCNNLSIRTWKKIGATKAFPASCPTCKQLSFLPHWWHLGSVISVEFLFWSSAILAITLKSWFALTLFPISILLLFIFGKKLVLKPTSKQSVKAERKLIFIVISSVLVLIFISSYISK